MKLYVFLLLNSNMDDEDGLLAEEVLDELAAEASRDAIVELQQRGIDIFYVEDNMHVLEPSGGSRVRIDFTHGRPGHHAC